MSKSLAETVNFGNAVQTKAYEKRAQQVDTFVQSESAQQKLARSGKAQTAQALDALAKLGTGVLDYKAQEREREVKALTDDLAGITAHMLEEARQDNNPYDLATFRDLPVRFQVKLRNQVGQAAGARAINEANAGITDEMRLNPDALAEHLESYRTPKETLTGMDAHENVGWETAWNSGLDKINNGVIQAQAVEGQRKVNEMVVNGVAAIINNSNEVLIQQQAETGRLPTAQEMSLAAASTYTQLEANLQATAVIEGIEIPMSVRKKAVIDEIIAQAKVTGNAYLLAPENIPKEYQDKNTIRAFAQARIDVQTRRESDARKAITDANNKIVTDTHQARVDAHEGTINRDTPNLTYIQVNAIEEAENRDKINDVTSAKNRSAFEDQIEISIADGRGVLIDGSGDPVLVNGESVPLNKDALNSYVEYNPLFTQNDAGTLINTMDENLVGFDVSQYLNGEPMTKANIVIKNALNRIPDDLDGTFTTEMQDWYADTYESMYYEKKRDKGWSTPLSIIERKKVRQAAHQALLAEVDQRSVRYKPAEVNLDGEIGSSANTVTPESVTEQPEDAPLTPIVNEDFTPDPNQKAYDMLEPSFKQKWNEIKDSPNLVRAWINRGLPIPNTEEEKQANYDEVRATVDMTDEELEDMMFGIANYSFGDGIRSPVVGNRLDWNKLPEETQDVLMDRYINTKASEFVNRLTNYYNKTFDLNQQHSFEKDIAEVLEDPKNVMKMDRFIKGSLKLMRRRPTPANDPIPWLDAARGTSWFVEDKPEPEEEPEAEE